MEIIVYSENLDSTAAANKVTRDALVENVKDGSLASADPDIIAIRLKDSDSSSNLNENDTLEPEGGSAGTVRTTALVVFSVVAVGMVALLGLRVVRREREDKYIDLEVSTRSEESMCAEFNSPIPSCSSDSI